MFKRNDFVLKYCLFLFFAVLPIRFFGENLNHKIIKNIFLEEMKVLSENWKKQIYIDLEKKPKELSFDIDKEKIYFGYLETGGDDQANEMETNKPVGIKIKQLKYASNDNFFYRRIKKISLNIYRYGNETKIKKKDIKAKKDLFLQLVYQKEYYLADISFEQIIPIDYNKLEECFIESENLFVFFEVKEFYPIPEWNKGEKEIIFKYKNKLKIFIYGGVYSYS